MQVEGDLHEHPEALLDRAMQGALEHDEQAELERHLARCPSCAAEIEAARIFKGATAPGRQDDALNRQAVDMALARLQTPESLGAKLGRAVQRLLRPRMVALTGALAVTAALLVFQMRRPLAPTPSAPPPPSEIVGRPLILEDGSEVRSLEKATIIQVAEQAPLRTTVRLPSGSAQFSVRHDSRRLFRVEAGAITIEDLGTVFRVAHEAEDRIRVAVSEGRVAVLISGSGARFEVGAGEDRVFSPAPEPSPAAEGQQKPVKLPAGSSVSAVARAPSRLPTADSAADLLQAADAARRSGRPQAAVAPLRSLLEHHAKDLRAPSAAFTLGWILLTDLGRAREAAGAFAEAERLAPRGALAEDAAARVAEAWQKAGDLDRAAQAARHYEQMYPTGRYISLMHGLVREK